MKKKMTIYLFIFMSFFLIANEVVTEYGHISYIKPNSEVFVERLNGEVDKAIINLPIVPGDIIITKDRSRCEIQFNNGTMIRLDNKTRLKVVTILAKAITSKKKITTLELLKGNLYIMSQVYNREIFQIITDNSAALFKKSTTAILQYDENKTDFNVFRGSINVMFGENVRSIKKERIKSKKFYTVTPENTLIKGKFSLDNKFLIWNKEINKDFDNLHRGISKVPKAIYRYSKGVIHWAEKWSSNYGEWIYDDIFGYVWRPYDESFLYDKRPFFHAQFITINDKLYCVPTQKWGWAPSQLGTWVFAKNSGWRWIPGNAFSGGMFPYAAQYNGSDLYGFSRYNNLNFWINSYYGGYDLYNIFRERGRRVWLKEYQQTFPTETKSISLPSHIKKLLSKLNKADISRTRKAISPTSVIKKGDFKYKFIKKIDTQKTNQIKSDLRFKGRAKTPVIKTGSIISKVKTNEKSARRALNSITFKDFNPDKRHALRSNIKIRYSSKTNSVVFEGNKMNKRFLYRKLKKQSYRYRGNNQRTYNSGNSTVSKKATKSKSSSTKSQRATGKHKKN